MLKQRSHTGKPAVNSNTGNRGWSNQSSKKQSAPTVGTNPDFESKSQTTGGKSYAPNNFVLSERVGAGNSDAGNRPESHDQKKAERIAPLNGYKR